MIIRDILKAAHPLRLTVPLALLLGACGQQDAPKEELPTETHTDAEASHANDGKITLSADQIAAAGIQIGRPTIGGAATIEVPATIESDPQGTQIVSAAIGGRIVSLSRNLGQSVRRGDMLAIIESREAASLKAEIEAARARLALANSSLAREQRLFVEKVSPEQDLIAARTAAAEARIALRLAQQQVAAAGMGGGGLNRIGISAPAPGQVIARTVVLGQTVAADAELYRIANLANLSLSFNLQPADAGRVQPGASVTITAPDRQATARVTFISPALDANTKLIPLIANLDNRKGQWRVGEPVTASVPLAGSSTGRAIKIPSTAVQTVAGKPVVFVRTRTGFQARPVALEAGSGDLVIVRSGLIGTEQIATINSFTLKAELGKSEAEHED